MIYCNLLYFKIKKKNIMSLINWEIDINKIDELINKLIKDTRKRCEDIIKSSSTKDVNILKVLNILNYSLNNIYNLS